MTVLPDIPPESARSWYTSDAFWASVAPVLFSAERFATARAEVPQIIEILGLESGQRVLDVFCGVGRYLVPLQDAGVEVVGVDRTPAYVDAAKAAAGPGSEVHIADLSRPSGDLPVSGPPLDAAIWLGSSTGYGDADTTVLRRIRGLLGPNRPLLIDATLTEDVGSESPEVSWEWLDEPGAQEGAGVVAVWRLEHHIGESPAGTVPASQLVGRWRRWAEGNVEEFRFRYGVYARAEWVSMLHDAGYVNITFPNDIPDFGDRAMSWILAYTPE